MGRSKHASALDQCELSDVEDRSCMWGRRAGRTGHPSEATPSFACTSERQVAHHKCTHHKLVAVLLGPVLISGRV